MDGALTPDDPGNDPPVDWTAGASEANAPALSQADVPRPAAAMDGFIDRITPDGVLTGWLHDPAQPALPVRVEVREGTAALATGLADRFRPDVRDAGHGDGYCGFAVQLPEAVLDGRLHTLAVRGESPGAAPLLLTAELALPDAGSGRLAALAAASPALLAVPPPPGGTDSGSDTAPVYVPGQYVNCHMPYPRPAYHVRGWHAPEAEFTWIDGLEASIELTLRRPRRRYTLSLDVLPNGLGNRVQTLEVFFNHFRMGCFEVPRHQTLSLRLPAELFILRTARIDLYCREAVLNTDFGSPDPRRLGIALRGWCIMPDEMPPA